ncbi:MAG TPA: XRE family transcriptional regulator [Cyanobacteria bacterium UBA11149]|nr:XRE family transcriptional regulator [Cyanobacteria bacterium UBA11367]HBE57103.1 XRE family transcriptional regulator [Cyanobacteria bacterium UBA11366]HBK62114.1 XRE family transcriptional regulator [Cyanobacteria bacterium UBA11166]HBR76632.1 XRE family transcriptional regulator [Cyanobacteria bacterium UBA11159]HBS68350.1 XRE family transcriptional regulator [Cyanobacteria bacterium UBA11153]HBW92420.1 XRE family transcriptional regulator [Cyanobacteria bacterium UBA11149]HCA94316.1 XR
MKQQPLGQDFESELKRLRERARLSQSAVAKLVGVTGKTVSNWERGVTPVNLSGSQVKDLSSVLGVTPEELTNLFLSFPVDD